MTDRDETFEAQGASRGGGRAEEMRRKAIEAYDGARQSVSQAGRRASDTLDEAPLVALAGGFAIGALIAALLPRTETEAKLIGPTTDRLTDKARAAAEAAREAGTSRLRELGLTPDSGREAIRSVVDGLSDAARASAQAAIGTVRSE